jgi:hypothetical protein
MSELRFRRLLLQLSQLWFLGWSLRSGVSGALWEMYGWGRGDLGV